MNSVYSRIPRICFTTALLLGVLTGRSAASECTSVTEETESRITQYLRQRLFAADASSSPLKIRGLSQVPGSCFWKIDLLIAGKGNRVVYLSPDQRFLTAGLYDLELNPDTEVKRIADATHAV